MEPLARAHGRLAADWVRRLQPDADEPVLLAARAHHLRRWEVPRSSYPAGRPGYLRWRRDQKARHAADVASLLAGVGYAPETVARVQALIRRDDLGTDPDAQLVEDAACLVFVETQLDSTAAALDAERLIEVLRRTARKMSPAAVALIAEVPVTDAGRQVLTAAFG